METINKRISILIKNSVFSVVILPTDNTKKTNLLLLWLLAWTTSGIIVMANYFTLTNTNTKFMLVVWLAFWAYFEFKIATVFMWKRFGKESLWIKNGQLFYQQTVNGRGKKQVYDLNLVSDFKLIEIEKTSFSDVFAQSFWVKSGERISFKYQAKHIKFGMQLTDEDAIKIIKQINAAL